MARRPPPGCGLRALPALLLLLLRPPATPGVTCPPPTSVKHADIRVKSYDLNSTERYTCNAGFKRKAGTSSLTECVLNATTNTAHWTIPNLKCINTYSYSSRTVTVTAAIFTPVAVLCIVGVGLLVCHKRSRQTSQTPGVEMENMEEMPMTGGTNGREEDAAAEAETRAPPLP
ncbi:interleukin-15 receptor subunit alpha isoform X3 [Hyaena hyaena]|uniref:interleukin-15 receptor subunit alpha isoform X3 n=1 Tax=Hyaena hyaena TaxID=95912 RepID=UPI001921E336|nr:interleukin-15 receptor subunit alpha isoform X3 [Hyaena hyaena]